MLPKYTGASVVVEYCGALLTVIRRNLKQSTFLGRAGGTVQENSMARPRVRFDGQATKSYLIAYNSAQFLGWAYVFVQLVVTLSTSDYQSTYAAVGGIVSTLQLVAFLEVLHASLGLVRSDPITALMQWAGRAHVLLVVIDNLPEVQTNISVCITFAAWATTEIVRYPWYALSGMGQCPNWLTYLRYTLFIGLYPAGVFGEMLAMYVALGPIKDGKLSFRMFDYLPISYHSFIMGLLTVYPLLFLVLYEHMFKRRRAWLSKRKGGSKGESKDQ